MSDITPQDLAAMGDVLVVLDEDTDSLGIEEAVALREAVQALAANCRVTLGLVDTQLVQILESPRQFGNLIYEIGNDGKWRPDWDKVAALVKRNSLGVDTETGEMRSAGAAVDRCMALMKALYVAPKTMPKQGGLEQMEVDKPDVASFDATGKKVKTTEVPPDDAT